jgi:hypothetical protein
MDLHRAGPTVLDVLAEGVLQLPPDDEDDPGEPGPQTVENRVVQESLAFGTEGFQLFEATVPTGHPGGQHYDGRIHGR